MCAEGGGGVSRGVVELSGMGFRAYSYPWGLQKGRVCVAPMGGAYGSGCENVENHGKSTFREKLAEAWGL